MPRTVHRPPLLHNLFVKTARSIVCIIHHCAKGAEFLFFFLYVDFAANLIAFEGRRSCTRSDKTKKLPTTTTQYIHREWFR